jgi:hypothetical protein
MLNVYLSRTEVSRVSHTIVTCVSHKCDMCLTNHVLVQHIITNVYRYIMEYGVATVSRIDKIIGLFCRIMSLLQGSFAKETYNFIDPANQRTRYTCAKICWMCNVCLTQV